MKISAAELSVIQKIAAKKEILNQRILQAIEDLNKMKHISDADNSYYAKEYISLFEESRGALAGITFLTNPSDKEFSEKDRLNILHGFSRGMDELIEKVAEITSTIPVPGVN